jgi:hypothetical protein
MIAPQRRTTFAKLNHMQSLYKRLKAAGYDRKFVRECVLPDWWEDSLGSVPANCAIAEIAIGRHLGFDIAQLRDPNQPLRPPTAGNFRLKRRSTASESDVAASVAVARRAAELVAESVTDVPAYGGPQLAAAVRAAILRNSAFVDLESLLTFCWSHGIFVVHLARTPAGAKRIDGLATFCGRRPVIVLASGRDSPSWLVYHLVHELGHIMRCHVKANGSFLVDQDLSTRDDDEQEKEADTFACELLTGQTDPAFVPTYGLTAEKLARAAWRYGEQHRIAPGTVVLVYGRSANRWGPAQNALKYLEQDTSGQAMIATALRQNMPTEELPETAERFLIGCAGLAV